jgi:CDP-glucose 4,6-dehydratase
MQLSLEKSFKDKTVLVTGHTGFKGSWLCIWLKELGANVVGYSLPPPTNPNLFEIAKLQQILIHVVGDVRDFSKLSQTIATHNPQIIFHLAAQPLVLSSFDQPKETFDINAGGTINLLEACRTKGNVQAIVIITTDKCYDNKEWIWGYRENDALGGNDPYSSSKAIAELAVASYRKSFFYEKTCVATARAGNVIGGGDFSSFRLMPDIMKAMLKKEPAVLRNPHSARPWIHVLDPLYGYLLLTERLLDNGQEFAEAWNFGPLEQKKITTKMIAEKAISLWGNGDYWINESKLPNNQLEMNILRLNWDKAANRLGWSPTHTWEQAVAKTVDWFKAFEQQDQMRNVCVQHIHDYTNNLRKYEIHPNISERSFSHRS